MIITPTQTSIYVSLKTLLSGIVPAGVEIIQGLGNRTPSPLGGFVAMTAINSKKLATNIHTYLDKYLTDPLQLMGNKDIENKMQLDVQVDFYGETAGDWANMAVAILRDEIGAKEVQCLYASEPMQAPLTSGEDQYISRWIVNVSLQENYMITTPMEFFDKPGEVNLIEVDTHFKA